MAAKDWIWVMSRTATGTYNALTDACCRWILVGDSFKEDGKRAVEWKGQYDTTGDGILNVRWKANTDQLNLPHGNKHEEHGTWGKARKLAMRTKIGDKAWGEERGGGEKLDILFYNAHDTDSSRPYKVKRFRQK